MTPDPGEAAAHARRLVAPFIDHDWRPAGRGPQADALFARLLANAHALGAPAVTWRLRCRHVDVYGDPETDAQTAGRRVDLLIRHMRDLRDAPTKAAYERWLELHNSGEDLVLGDRSAVLRHLTRLGH